MSILLFGSTGQVGREVMVAAAAAGIPLLIPERATADLTDASAPARIIGEAVAGGVRLVVNAAAYTAVDRAEQDRDTAYAVNALAPGRMAAACAAAGIPLLHLSTDYVFDGTKAGAYTEDDPVTPLGVYGTTKEAGEQAVRAVLPQHLILRTSWVFSPYGTNFVRTMLRLAADRPELRVVADQTGCPTAAADIAAAIMMAARRIAAAQEGGGATAWGTYHYSGRGRTTWYDFAEAVMAERRRITGAPSPTVHPIATTDYPTPARRPANSELDCSRLGQRWGIHAVDWRPGLACTVERLLAD